MQLGGSVQCWWLLIGASNGGLRFSADMNGQERRCIYLCIGSMMRQVLISGSPLLCSRGQITY